MDFEKRFREVESLAGSEISMDLFNEHYQSLLLEVQRSTKPKAEKLERMRRLLHRQFLYLLAQWRRAKAEDALPEEKRSGETTSIGERIN